MAKKSFIIRVQSGGQEWDEVFTRDCESIQEEAKKIISNFNNGLRPGEKPRKIISVTESETDADNMPHDWNKSCLVTQMGKGSSSFDTYKFSRCNITGKRFGLSDTIIRDKKFSGSEFQFCKAETKKQTTNNSAMIKKIKLATLVIDAGTDVRSEINEDTVTEYGLAAKAKDKFPPLVVFETEDGLLLADGFHRFFGFERQGIKEYDCEIRKGTRADAIKFALGCNTTHGLRRSNADKRHAVEIALKEFPKLSDRGVSDICAVSHTFVGEVREKFDAQKQLDEEQNESGPEKPESTPPPRPVSREGKDGKTYKVPARPSKSSAAPARPGEPAKPPGTLDATGIAVPEEIVPYWDSTFMEAQRLLSMISEIRTRISRAAQSNEPAFREVDCSDVGAKLDQIYADVRRAKPYAICPSCNGIETKDCTTCKGRGFVSAFFWDHCVSAEVKKATGRK